MNITALQIEQWADKIEARALLPELIRRLIHETVSKNQIMNINFPAGRETWRPGIDGNLTLRDAVAAPLCEGQSVWEMGTNKNTSQKANADYKKRLPEASTDKTFYFITPRNWQAGEEWASARATDGWKNVKVLDANFLEQWLETKPFARLWFLKILGIPVNGICTVDEFWEEWAEICDPKLKPELFISQLGDSKYRLKEFLNSDNQRPLHIVANSRDEAVTTICALLKSDEFPNTLILKTEEEARNTSIFLSAEKPIIIANSLEIGKAVGNIVGKAALIICEARGDNTYEKDSIVLSRLADFSEQFSDQAKREHYGKKSGYSITSLRRLTATNTALRKPKWANLSGDRFFIWLALIGGWDDGFEEDKKLLNDLISDKNYSDLERFAQELTEQSDPPLERAGKESTCYKLLSRIDAIHLIFSKINKKDIDDFFVLLEKILSEADPALNKAQSELLFQERRQYSIFLREGVCDGLILINLYKKSFKFVLEQHITDKTTVLFNTIFSKSGALYSLNTVLPKLAEAAPEKFLDIIQEKIAKNNNEISKLFEEGPGFLFSNTKHPSLLWALERLAWNRGTLKKTSSILCQLHEQFDTNIPSNYSNRPLGSLNGIYRSWLPHTAANVETRCDILDNLYEHHPKAIIELANKLASVFDRTGSIINTPTWTDDALVVKRATGEDRFKVVTHAISLIKKSQTDERIDLSDRKKWLETYLINFEYWGKSNAQEISNLIKDKICSSDDEVFSKNFIYNCRKRKQSFQRKNKNKEQPENQWLIEICDDLIFHFEGDNIYIKYAYLFDPKHSHSNLSKSWAEHVKEIEDKRAKVIKEIHDQYSIRGLIEISLTSTDTSIASESSINYLGASDSTKYQSLLELLLEVSHDPLRIKRYIYGLFFNVEGNLSVDETINLFKVLFKKYPSLTVEIQSAILHGLRLDDKKCRDYLTSFSTDVLRHYFSQFRSILAKYETQIINGEHLYKPEIAVFLAKKYLDFSYPGTGLSTLQRLANLDPHVLFSLIENLTGKNGDLVPLGDDLEEYIRELEKNIDELASGLNVTIDEAKIKLFSLELQFCEAFNFYSVNSDLNNQKPFYIHCHLAKYPESFFNFILMMVAKDDDGNVLQTEYSSWPEENRGKIASLAWNALYHWEAPLPGQELPLNPKIDAQKLKDWVENVRTKAREHNILNFTDDRIGDLLAKVPIDLTNESYPYPDIPPEICEVINGLENPSKIIDGMCAGRYNRRGATSGGVDDSGFSDDTLANAYFALANKYDERYPIVGRIFKNLGNSFKLDYQRSQDRNHQQRLNWH